MSVEIGSDGEERPIGLAKAADVLRERYPKYAFSKDELRHLCTMGALPYLEVPRCGRLRPVAWKVRVSDLLREFRKMERKAKGVFDVGRREV